MQLADNKGMALDDTTFEFCSNKIPAKWPMSSAPMKTVRIFKPWGVGPPRVFHTNRTIAFEDLKRYAQAMNVQYLVGISVTCDDHADDVEWENAKELISILGEAHVMALAIGNECDGLLGAERTHPGCRQRLWYENGYVEKFNKRVADFDTIPGMSAKPLTAVFTGKALGRYGTNKFVHSMWEKYHTRYVLSINIYPQFSSGLAQAGCQGAVDVGTKFTMDEPAGFVPNFVKSLRKEIRDNGFEGMKLWITETGWSTEGWCVLKCDDACKGPSAQKTFYRNFLKWDLTAGNESADHVFYFTIRDSANFGHTERFGMIHDCGDTECKF
jgi:hypothetical protein